MFCVVPRDATTPRGPAKPETKAPALTKAQQAAAAAAQAEADAAAGPPLPQPLAKLQGLDIAKAACAAAPGVTYLVTDEGHLYRFVSRLLFLGLVSRLWSRKNAFWHLCFTPLRLLRSYDANEDKLKRWLEGHSVVDVACGQEANFTVAATAAGAVFAWGEASKAGVLGFADKKVLRCAIVPSSRS